MNDKASAEDTTHMLVVVDTFDYEDYPVYISNHLIDDAIKKYHHVNMQRIMEIYSYGMDLESQLKQGRVWNI